MFELEGGFMVRHYSISNFMEGTHFGVYNFQFCHLTELLIKSID